MQPFKFKVNDKVYFIRYRKIVEGIIVKIWYGEWRSFKDISDQRQHVAEELFFFVKTYTDDSAYDGDKVVLNDVFATKEELIKSLQEQAE